MRLKVYFSDRTACCFETEAAALSTIKDMMENFNNFPSRVVQVDDNDNEFEGAVEFTCAFDVRLERVR